MKINKIFRITNWLYVMAILICCGNINKTAIAQTGNATDYFKHSMPQPEAMCLINQMNLSNSLHTGAVNSNIPLYNIQGDMLNLPISLSYVSNGIKVTEEASRVGLGWKLNAGGRVTRVIRGIEDEHFSSTTMPITGLNGDNTPIRQKVTSFFPNFKGNPDATRIIVEGHLHNTSLPNDIPPISLSHDKVSTDLPDLFYYSVGDLSGKFTINPDLSVNQMPYNNVKITPILGSNEKQETLTDIFKIKEDLPVSVSFPIPPGTSIPAINEDGNDRITGFTIEDETGRIFTFNDIDLSNNVEWSPLFDANFNIPTDLFGERTTSWNISTIEHVANRETIDFEYEKLEFNANSIITNHKLVEGNDCLCKQPTKSTTANSANESKILKNIKWNHGQIDFTTVNRVDISGDKHYSKMDISLNTVEDENVSSIIKSFQFNTSYFNSNVTRLANMFKRLKLNGLQELGADGTANGKPAYVFNYNETSLPPKNSDQRDLWGYFNGVASSDGIPNIFNATGFEKDRISTINPNSSTITQRTLAVLSKAKAGILTNVTNPKGGATTFNYELNHFNYFNKEYLGAGLRVLSKTVSDGIKTANNIVYNYKYTQAVNSSTSGYVSGIPIYGHLCKKATTGNEFFSNTYRSSRRLDYPIGNEVGYNRVTVSNYTGGYTEYVFNSALEFPDVDNATIHSESCDAFLGVDDHFPYASKTSFDYKRGLLISEQIYNTEEIATPDVKYRMVNQYQFYNKANVTVTIELNTGEDGNTGKTTSTRTITSDFIALKQQIESTDGVDETITDLSYNNTIQLWDNNKISKLRETKTTIKDNDINLSSKTYKTEFTYKKHDGQDRIDIETITNKVNGKVVDKTTYNYKLFNAIGPFMSTVERQESTFNVIGALQTGSKKTQLTYNDYDSNGRPTSLTGKGEPLAKTYTYTHFGEVDTETHGNFKKSYTYSKFHLVETSTDIDGQVTEYEYDDLMRIKTIKERCRMEVATLVCELFEPDPTGRSNEDDEEICGKKTNYTYTYKTNSNTNNTIEVENIYGCDQYNVTTTVLDGLSRTTSTTKIDHANVTKNEQATKQDVTTSIIYNNRGLVESQTDEAGNTTTFAYYGDPLNRVKTITGAEGFITTKTYNTNYINEIAGFNCNSLNKVTTTDADGISSSVFTDRLGRVVAEKIHQCVQECEPGCDDMDCIVECEQKSITYTKYDDKNRVIKILPPGTTEADVNLIYQYTYDGADNVTSKKVPDKGLVEYKYDARNLQIAMRDQNIIANRGTSKWLATEYDNYDRVHKQGFGGENGSITFNSVLIQNFYDKSNNINTASSSYPIYSGKMHKSKVNILEGSGIGKEITTDYTLDEYGRIEQERWTNHLGQKETKDYTYDAADKITGVTHTIDDDDDTKDVTTTATYSYDVQGRLVNTKFMVNGEEQQVSELTYTLNDLMDTKILGGGMQTLKYTYNKNNWLTGINKAGIDAAGASLPVCPTVGSKPQNAYTSSEKLFSMELKYTGTGVSNPRKNGNIAEMQWQVEGRKADHYNFTYDYLNRLESANSLNDNFNTAYTYDARGNIQTLKRNGLIKDDKCYKKIGIDDLKYTYYDGTNQLKTVVDLNACDNDIIVDIDSETNARLEEIGTHEAQKQVISEDDLSTKDKKFRAGEIVTLNPGFSHDGQFSAIIKDCNIGFLGGKPKILRQYYHDDNGNLTKDENKGFTISYNYLNLPYQAVKDDGSKIEWLWTADGRKLQKKTTVNNKTTTKDYLQEVELTDGKLQAAYHSEGRYVAGNSNYKKWEFNLKDHLGNLRLVFNGQKKQSGDGYSVYIQQESHYYPFGMPIEGPWYEPNEKNDYLYNGKEYNTDLGLNWSDYGARFYDPEIARWTSVDPLADNYVEYSPYNYVLGNPVKNIDPDGRSVLNSVSGDSYYIDDRYGTSLTMTLSDELFHSIVSSNPGEYWFRQLDWSNYLSFLAKSVSFDLNDVSTQLQNDYGAFGWLIGELGYTPASIIFNDLGEGKYKDAGTEIVIDNVLRLKYLTKAKDVVVLGAKKLEWKKVMNAKQVKKLLKQKGFKQVFNKGKSSGKGSHTKWKKDGSGHSVTVPDHNPIKKGTLGDIKDKVNQIFEELGN